MLADRRRVLGEDHPDTLTTRGTLAWTVELQGRYADAEQQYRSLLADRERILGASHPDTLIARQEVARMLGMQRRYAEAEQLTREVAGRPAHGCSATTTRTPSPHGPPSPGWPPARAAAAKPRSSTAR